MVWQCRQCAEKLFSLFRIWWNYRFGIDRQRFDVPYFCSISTHTRARSHFFSWISRLVVGVFVFLSHFFFFFLCSFFFFISLYRCRCRCLSSYFFRCYAADHIACGCVSIRNQVLYIASFTFEQRLIHLYTLYRMRLHLSTRPLSRFRYVKWETVWLESKNGKEIAQLTYNYSHILVFGYVCFCLFLFFFESEIVSSEKCGRE